VSRPVRRTLSERHADLRRRTQIAGAVPGWSLVPSYEALGFVTFAFMGSAAVSLIAGLLVVAFVGDHRVRTRDGASRVPPANL
jgi:hypothetical protein